MDKHYKSSSESKRDRSRSPIDRSRDEKYHKKYHNKEDHKKRYIDSSDSDDDKKEAPPAPRISMNFNRFSKGTTGGIQIKLNTAQSKKPVPIIQKSPKISNVFNADDSSEEEMPPEAKMRMRNIGKDTPTSSGPNSFGKTKQGFIDTKKMFERKLKQMADEISND